MNAWKKCFGAGTLKIIGMIHVPALPGTPKNNLEWPRIVSKVKEEVAIYSQSAIDAILIENMHDVPYLHPALMGPETTTFMTRICREVRQSLPASVPCGVQILAAANKEAMAVAAAAELQFIRCEGFVFSHIADEGWTDSCAASLLRYRENIDAEEIMIFTDLKKKHSSHAITSDVNIGETAEAAELFLSDGLVVTGSGTGRAADPSDLARVRASSHLPVLIGSGIDHSNIHAFSSADGLIVGSSFKQNGRWDGDLDACKINMVMNKVEEIRKQIARNGN